MIGRHRKADPVTEEPRGLVSHPYHPVNLVGTEGFLGGAQKEQGHQPFCNGYVRTFQDRSNGHSELSAAGSAKIDPLAHTPPASQLGGQFGNPFFARILAVRTDRTTGPAPRFQKRTRPGFIAIRLCQLLQNRLSRLNLRNFHADEPKPSPWTLAVHAFVKYTSPDRLSWRRFVGLGLQDAVPDETTLVNFRKRLRQYGQHEKLLGLVNQQLEQKGLILKTCTLVDATLLQAARRAPAKGDKTGGDGNAGYTVKQGQPHYGYKAHVAVDETHTLIREVSLTSANVHDSREFERVVKGDEEMVLADKAYWSQARSQWCGERGIANGILRKASRGETLRPATLRANRLLSSIRCKIEKVFGWWKRSAGYRRVRYVGHEPNRLELEFKSICWNLKRLTNLLTT